MTPALRGIEGTIIIALILLISLPWVGVVLAGLPVERYLEFPPRSRYLIPEPFSWTVFSLLAALVCAVPLLLNTFGINYERIWLISSVIGSIVTVYGAYGCIKIMRGAIAKKSSWFLFALLQGMGYLVTLAIILNAADLVFHREPGPIIAGVFYALFVAGYMFSRLLLLPLWRIVREQEAANSKVTSPA